MLAIGQKSHKVLRTYNKQCGCRVRQTQYDPPASNPNLWAPDLETDMRDTYKVGNLPSKFGHARPLGSWVICYVRDGQTDKSNTYCPYPTSVGIIKWTTENCQIGVMRKLHGNRSTCPNIPQLATPMQQTNKSNTVCHHAGHRPITSQFTPLTSLNDLNVTFQKLRQIKYIRTQQLATQNELHIEYATCTVTLNGRSPTITVRFYRVSNLLSYPHCVPKSSTPNSWL